MVIQFNKSLISLLLALFSITSVFSYEKRGMVIAYESGLAENVGQTLNQLPGEPDCPVGIGPIAGTILTALYQEAVPVLISKHIWKNISDHIKIYEDFMNHDIYTLKQKYIKFNRFKTEELIKNFKQNLTYFSKLYEEINNLAKDPNCSAKKLENLLWNDPVFDRKNAPENIKQLDLSIINEMSLYLLCKHILDTKFIIKDLNGAILFIPLSYIQKIVPNYEHKVIKEVNNSKELTKLEKILGLKIDHFKDALIIDNKLNVKPEKEFEESIYNIFVHKKMTLKEQGWIFYMSGHGNFCQDSYDEINNEEKKIKELEQKYKDLKKEKSKSNQIAKTKSDLKNLKNSIKDEKRYISKLKKVSRINGLYKSSFRNILNFFNLNLNTKLLCYSSCSSGGQNNNDAFKTKEKKNIILSYPVISLTLTEAIIHNKLPQMSLHFYKDGNNYYKYSFDNLINSNKKTVNITSFYNFQTFFNQDINSKVTRNIINHISLWIIKPFDWIHKITKKIKKTYLSNMPLIRPANSKNFEFFDKDRISSITINDNSDNIIKTNHDHSAIFINTQNINKIVISKTKKDQEFPAIISLQPGKSSHIFSEIHAQSFGLCEILEGFFPFEELSSAKLFIIKKLICKDDLINKTYTTAIFENVIIFNNALLESNTRANGIVLSAHDITYQVLWQAKIGLTYESAQRLSFDYYNGNQNRYLAYFDKPYNLKRNIA